MRPIQADGEGRREKSGSNSGAYAVLARPVMTYVYHASLGGRCRHHMDLVLSHRERDLPGLQPVSRCTRPKGGSHNISCTSTYVS